MNARERLFAVLEPQPTDRVPIWLLFPYHRTGYYGDVHDEPSYRPVFEASKQYAIMLNRRNPHVSLFAPEVKQWHEAWTEGGDKVEREFLEHQGRRLYSEIRRHSWGTDIKRLLCTAADDLEFYCSLPLNTDPDAITAQLDRASRPTSRTATSFPEEYGAMMLDLGEPVGRRVYGVSKLEEYLGLVADPLRSDCGLVRPCDGAKAAGLPVLPRPESARSTSWWAASSPARRSSAAKPSGAGSCPIRSELIDLIHAHGCKVIQHYHGQIKLILPDFLEMGPDGLHTIEAPPIGNCTFAEAFDIVGDKIALIGNIQFDEFTALSPDEMRRAVIAVLDECRGKRLILSPSAGPYEESITPEMAKNYLAFMKTAWGYLG